MESYCLIFRRLKHPYTLASVSGPVATLLKRPRAEVFSMLTLPGLVLRNGLPLSDAKDLQAELMQSGCVCLLQEEPEIDQRRPDGDTRGRIVDGDCLSTISILVLAAAILTALLAWLMDWMI